MVWALLAVFKIKTTQRYTSFVDWVGQCLLATEKPEYEAALIDGYQNTSDPEIKWRERSIRRCIAALQKREFLNEGSELRVGVAGSLASDYEPSAWDGIPLLRQISALTGFMVELPVPRELPFDFPKNPIARGLAISNDAERSMFRAIKEPVSIKGVLAEDEIELLYPRSTQRRRFNYVPGDGVLLNTTRFKEYQSRSQKRAVQRILTAPEKSIILVSLPTGSGKSLLCHLPALHWSGGGQYAAGNLSLLICPTIALVEDQYLSTVELFGTEQASVFKLTGDTPKSERPHFIERLRSGDGALCIMTPEVFQGYARTAIEDAAREKNLKMITIDEVHLIDTWGAKFRPSIQRISTLRKKLVEYDPKIITLLLSATIRPQTEERIRSLYCSNSDEFQFFDGSNFRVEHDFLRTFCASPEDRSQYLMNVIPFIPRPFIIYTTKVDDANAIYQEIRNLGSSRVRVFTGETNWRDREKIITEWRRDFIDVVVATSAFGLGIDKSDVRAVIHASRPEGLDRLYQEIGRGGRDGFPCLAWSITTEADSRVAMKHALGNLLTTPIIIDRWVEMLKTASRPEYPGEIVVRLDLNSRTAQVKAQSLESGVTNREWNEGALLILERAGLVQAIKQVSLDDDPRDLMDFIILDTDLLPNKTQSAEGIFKTLQEKVETTREKEQTANRDNFTLSNRWFDPSNTSCVSHILGAIYYFPSDQECGRCWACRAKGVAENTTSSDIEKFPDTLSPPIESFALNPGIKDRIGYEKYKVGIIEYEKDPGVTGVPRPLSLLIRRLAQDGVQRFWASQTYLQEIANSLANESTSLGLTGSIEELHARSYSTQRIAHIPSVVIAVNSEALEDDEFVFWQEVESFVEELEKDDRVIFVLPRGFAVGKDYCYPLAERITTKDIVHANEYINSLD